MGRLPNVAASIVAKLDVVLAFVLRPSILNALNAMLKLIKLSRHQALVVAVALLQVVLALVSPTLAKTTKVDLSCEIRREL